MKKITIFTDGACSGNPGPGGWGVLLRFESHGKIHEKHLSGSENETTNNRMELTAAIKALETLKEPCLVDLTTDSKYVKNGITEWLQNWKKNNWKNSARKPVKNDDLWKRLDELVAIHKVKWHWVKGHNGHLENSIVDKLATDAIKKSKKN